MASNRHKVDLLSDIRSQLKALKAREAELRAEVVASGDMTGDEFVAEITQAHFERIDLDHMRRELGTRFLEPFMRKRTSTVVRLKPRQTKKAKRTTT
jgi:hypothetical protein